MNLRVIFMGSPAFALPVLQRLADTYSLTGVVTQPDRPSGRGRQLTPPPVKELAMQLGIEVFQPERLRTPEAFARLQTWQPELIVVAAFGQILRQNVLDLPKYGCINVHASYLPRWRGAAPIQAAILNGDAQSGVTIMRMDAGVDTGDILAQTSVAIEANETGGSLTDKLAKIGADCLLETLPAYLSGQLTPQPQSAEGVTYAPIIHKSDGILDFTQPAEVLARKVRAFNPVPGAFFLLDGVTLKVHQAHATASLTDTGEVGAHSTVGNRPAVGTADGWLVLDEVQAPGKKPMPGDVFLRGARNWLQKS